MIQVRKSEERGHFDHGWLDTRHTFSFGMYHDPAFMGFRSLRVINEDVVAPGKGFGEHPHQDMEIITYVLNGALAHRDSLGNGEAIRAGDVQRMTAGSGIEHSEFNASKTEPVHLLQIWIRPRKRGLEPGYEQKHFELGPSRGRLVLVASQDGAEGSVTIQTEARLYAGVLGKGQSAALELKPGRHAWVQVAHGGVEVNGTSLRAGDGAAVSEETELALRANEDAEVLVFDLA